MVLLRAQALLTGGRTRSLQGAGDRATVLAAPVTGALVCFLFAVIKCNLPLAPQMVEAESLRTLYQCHCFLFYVIVGKAFVENSRCYFLQKLIFKKKREKKKKKWV